MFEESSSASSEAFDDGGHAINNKAQRRKKMSEAIERKVRQYRFNGSDVRVVMDGEDPWFVAKDVCDILGTRTDTVRQIVGNKRVKSIIPNTIGDNGRGHGKDILVISEPGIYKLVLVSRKPEAEKFQDWVTDEVLPSIRKHGVYMTDNVLEQAKTDPAIMNNIVDRLIDERERSRILEDELRNTIDERDEAVMLSNKAIRLSRQALMQRDIAVKQRALISNRREATACQRNSVLQRHINSLEEAKMIIEDELESARERADRYDRWRGNISKGLRKHYGYGCDDDDCHQIDLFDGMF